MTKKINLKKILSKYPTFTNEGGYGEYYVIEAMKEVCQEILKLAADNAKVKENFTVDDKAFVLNEYVINKQSILNTINEIE